MSSTLCFWPFEETCTLPIISYNQTWELGGNFPIYGLGFPHDNACSPLCKHEWEWRFPCGENHSPIEECVFPCGNNCYATWELAFPNMGPHGNECSPMWKHLGMCVPHGENMCSQGATSRHHIGTTSLPHQSGCHKCRAMLINFGVHNTLHPKTSILCTPNSNPPLIWWLVLNVLCKARNKYRVNGMWSFDGWKLTINKSHC